jgi:hypothetical protein
VAKKAYRWEPEAGLYEIDGERVVGVIDVPAPGSEERRRVAAACRILTDAEASRHGRRRPPAMLEAMAAAFARDRLSGSDAAPVTVTLEQVLAWVDGPGLDVILDFVLSRRRD